MEDHIKCLKLVQAEESYSINGGIMIQPSDVREETAAIEMFYAMLLYSDKAIMLPTGFKEEMELIFEAGCEVFGGNRFTLHGRDSCQRYCGKSGRDCTGSDDSPGYPGGVWNPVHSGCQTDAPVIN